MSKMNSDTKKRKIAVEYEEVQEFNQGESRKRKHTKRDSLRKKRKYTWVYFDLETTGLGYSHITQLSAICESKVFSRYVIPKKPIGTDAQSLTGLHMKKGVLCKRGKPLDTVSIKECISAFADWLKQFQNPVLVAHNAHEFDARVLCNVLIEIEDTKLSEVLKGFSDTLAIFREVKRGRKSYKLGDLVGDYLGEDCSSHDATEDARALERLVQSQNITDDVIRKYIQPLQHVKDFVRRDRDN